MDGEIRFWFQPTTDRVILFFITLFGIFIAVQFLKSLYNKTQENRLEKQLRKKLERFHLLDRPEETVVRELVARYKVRPPDLLLSSLQQFDQVASEEILRLEREKMDLADRLDRIEYLYSIRLNAFSKEPSVGGVETLLGPDYPSLHAPGEPDTETILKEASTEPHKEKERDYETTLDDQEMANLGALLSLGDDEPEERPEG